MLSAEEEVAKIYPKCVLLCSSLLAPTNGTVMLKNLLDDTSVKGEVIVCNIMAEVLIFFAPYIGGNLKDGGTIILSGILADRLERVKDAYQKAGFVFAEQKIKGEWSALVMKKGLEL